MRQSVQDQIIGCRANTVLAEKARSRAAAEGASLSEYIRDLIRRDVREAA